MGLKDLSYPSDSLVGVQGDVRSAFGSNNAIANGSQPRSLRTDLLFAADSVTNAMSTLVRELNSGSDDEDSQNIRKPLDYNRDCDNDYSPVSHLSKNRILTGEFKDNQADRNKSGKVGLGNGTQ
ncbi:dystrobrevin alpha-like [Ctenocephalides felis]|uniref:dystrobrevin alpha-like n=1 Tax=Ctenocephalides felis TaxID=7515 RepID=UPI000E6E529F|nr:dystrobrevin alpha-like [Ctenocephalides felis]